MDYKKILMAVDSSENSMKAAKKVLELAHQLEAKAALIFVVDKSHAMELYRYRNFPRTSFDPIKEKHSLSRHTMLFSW